MKFGCSKIGTMMFSLRPIHARTISDVRSVHPFTICPPSQCILHIPRNSGVSSLRISRYTNSFHTINHHQRYSVILSKKSKKLECCFGVLPKLAGLHFACLCNSIPILPSRQPSLQICCLTTYKIMLGAWAVHR